MAEEATASTVTEELVVEEASPTTGEDDLGDAGKKALDAERSRAKEAERRAKSLERELEKVRQAQMSESEKAIAEAEARGKSSAASEFGQRFAREKFVAAAARRNGTFDATEILDDLNLARFVGEDGEPDPKAIAAAVERLVPEPSSTPNIPSFDGGTRQVATSGGDMNAIIRGRTGRK